MYRVRWDDGGGGGGGGGGAAGGEDGNVTGEEWNFMTSRNAGRGFGGRFRLEMEFRYLLR